MTADIRAKRGSLIHVENHETYMIICVDFKADEGLSQVTVEFFVFVCYPSFGV